MKRVICIVLTLAMVLGLSVFPAFADNENQQNYACEYVSLKTEDGVSLPGLCYMPTGETNKIGILFSSGQGATFYAPMATSYLAPHYASLGYVFLSLDRRDAGPNNACYGFNESVMDHKYGVDYLESLGCEKIIFIGHSYGCITALQYTYLTKDPRVAGFALYAPIGSLYEAYFVYQGQEVIDGVIAECKAKVEEGNGAEYFLMPGFMPGAAVSLATYAAVLDKRSPETEGNGPAIAAKLSDTALPILCVRDPVDAAPAVMGPTNEVADQYIQSNPNLQYVYLEDTREEGDTTVSIAAHGMLGKMDEVIKITDNSIKEIN